MIPSKRSEVAPGSHDMLNKYSVDSRSTGVNVDSLWALKAGALAVWSRARVHRDTEQPWTKQPQEKPAATGNKDGSHHGRVKPNQSHGEPHPRL